MGSPDKWKQYSTIIPRSILKYPMIRLDCAAGNSLPDCKSFFFSALGFGGNCFLFLWKVLRTQCPAANLGSQLISPRNMLITRGIGSYLQTPSPWQPHCIQFPRSKVRPGAKWE